MAYWDKLSSRGKIDDRRSMAPAVMGLSLTGVVLLVALNYLSGGDMSSLLSQLDQSSMKGNQVVETGQYEGEDEYEVFAATVLGSTNDMWNDIFKKKNLSYSPPNLVLFRVATDSACGGAPSEIGPHYCPLDETIYLDETFFDELTRRFGATGGDVAEAYVIANEVGHHAQHLLAKSEGTSGTQATTNQDSISQELQADCYSGLWAHSIRDKNVFLPGEIKEAMDAAAAAGDDRIQKRTSGYVNKETWTH